MPTASAKWAMTRKGDRAAGREVQAGPPDSGRPRRRGQHHQGRDQGHRHRFGRDRGRVDVRQFHCHAGDGLGRPDRQHVDDEVHGVRRKAHRCRADGADRPVDRRRRALVVQLDAHPCGGPRGVLHHQGVPHPVPRQGNLGRHEEAQLCPRGRHLHQRRPGRIDRPGVCWPCSVRSSSACCWDPMHWAASWPA